MNTTRAVHRCVGATILAICLGAWSVQLGGVAALQSACRTTTDVDAKLVKALLKEANEMIRSLDSHKPVPGSLVAKALQAQARAIEQLAKVSGGADSVLFAHAPDCRQLYQFQWLSLGLQLLALCLAWYALFAGFLPQARVGVCCLLVVATVLAMENVHLFFHVREYAAHWGSPGGLVFFTGCIATSVADLVLLLVLGISERQTQSVGMEEAWPLLAVSNITKGLTSPGKVVLRKSGGLDPHSGGSM